MIHELDVECNWGSHIQLLLREFANVFCEVGVGFCSYFLWDPLGLGNSTLCVKLVSWAILVEGWSHQSLTSMKFKQFACLNKPDFAWTKNHPNGMDLAMWKSQFSCLTKQDLSHSPELTNLAILCQFSFLSLHDLVLEDFETCNSPRVRLLQVEKSETSPNKRQAKNRG